MAASGSGRRSGRRAPSCVSCPPGRDRGHTDLLINGSFWIGAAIGAAGSIVLLDPAVLGPDLRWRAGLLLGRALALFIFVLRLWIPESPRWLMTHGRAAEAEAAIARIEDGLRERGYTIAPVEGPRV